MVAGMVSPPPVALCIAGSDCSAGAGIQADLKTMAAFGVHGLTAVTSVVAETPNLVSGVYPVEPAALQDQIRILLESYPIGAVKTGMLGSKRHVVATAELLEESDAPVIVDPVMVASTGDPLLDGDAVASYRERLLPRATLITPNLPEALRLLDAETRTDLPAETAARRLADRFGCSVLLTGGHGAACDVAVDYLVHEGEVCRLEETWIKVPNSHGTGCTISAAITAAVAWGDSVPQAVRSAKDFVTRALRDSYQWKSAGAPPLHAINQLPATAVQRS
jgi:hydroxymethylpyrimidine/phosphomethylpyrimidine kinase